MRERLYSPRNVLLFIVVIFIPTLMLASYLRGMAVEDHTLKEADYDRIEEWGRLQNELMIENEERAKQGLPPKLHPMTVPVPSRYKPPSTSTP